MNNLLAFDFTVEKERKTITVKREFAAEISLVWDAYTKRELLDQWWAPRPWKARTRSMDFRVGGQWHYAMVGPNGEEHWAMAEYTAIQSELVSGQKKFTGLDAFADADGNVNKELPQSTWEILFTDKGPITLVECNISYPDVAQLEATIQMGFKEGFATAMEGLDELLTSLKNK